MRRLGVSLLPVGALIALVSLYLHRGASDRRRLPVAAAGLLVLNSSHDTRSTAPLLITHVAYGGLVAAAGAAVLAIGAAAFLLVLRLVRLWPDQFRADAHATHWVVLIPTAALVLSLVAIARAREITWGAGALAAILVYVGYVEWRTGLENFRVPAILRVDRL